MIDRTPRLSKLIQDKTENLLAYALAKAHRRRIAATHSRHSPHLRAGVARTTSLPSHRSIFGVALQVVRWCGNLEDRRPLDRVVTPENVSMAHDFAVVLYDLEGKGLLKRY